MHHFAMLHTAKSATSSPPSRVFKETGAQRYPAAAHLISVIPDDHFKKPTEDVPSVLEESTNSAAFAFKTKNNPDMLMCHKAMADGDRKLWLKGMDVEMTQLEKIDCWDMIPRSEATKRVVPSTWACKRKRFTDSQVKKCKSRFCVRGDLEDNVDQQET
jgi:hypothetical protein